MDLNWYRVNFRCQAGFFTFTLPFLSLFLEIIAATTAGAKKTLLDIKKLFAAYHEKPAGLGRSRDSAEHVFPVLSESPC